MSKPILFVRMVLAECLYLFSFIAMWFAGEKFAQSVIKPEHVSWIMFCGGVLVIVGIPIAKLIKHLFLTVLWRAE